MPLKLNIGLSRKIGEANYGSRGASVNLEMELEGALVSEPGKLQQRIRQCFDLVRTSLAAELNGNGATNSPQVRSPEHQKPPSNGDQANPPRRATQSQVKALFAITKAQRIDLAELLQKRFCISRAEDLTIKEASELIDQLKKNDQKAGGRR